MQLRKLNVAYPLYLALSAGAEVQFSGGLFPVNVGNVLGRGTRQHVLGPAPGGGKGASRAETTAEKEENNLRRPRLP